MKAWRSNQDLENLIRRAGEVHRIGGDTIEKQIKCTKKKKLLDISCPLDIVPRCFYKVEVCWWLNRASTLRETPANMLSEELKQADRYSLAQQQSCGENRKANSSCH